MPLSLRPGDPLLATKFPLPDDPVVVCTVFEPSQNSPDPADAVELARRAVIHSDNPSSLLQSILPSVQCGHTPLLYLFLVTQEQSAGAAAERLSSLQFTNLHQLSHSVFRIDDLTRYRTSTSSASAPTPDVLLSAASGAVAHTYAYFLDAVRAAIICELSEAVPRPPNRISPKRLQDGFILERSSTSSDWASGWSQGVHTRPIVHFRLQIQISYNDLHPSHLIVHAIPTPTPYSGLPSSPNPGSPIVLMPYGTPAYFLNAYSGPSNTLVKQFRDSLQGLGAGLWEGSPNSPDANHTPFIIGWIRVENRQGEDKGMLFVWPSRLCLSYSSVCSHRPPLSYIPEMPAPLQSSPQVPTSAREGPTPIDAPEDPHFYERAPRFQFEPYQTPPHSDPLNAFHSLTTTKSRDLRSLAHEVGGYVDSVVRERERERERLKRERELGIISSPKFGRPTGSTSRMNTATSFPSSPPTHLMQSTVQPHLPPVSHAQQAQLYYPSPPQSGPVPSITLENTSPDMTRPAPLPASNTVLPPVSPLPAIRTDINNSSDGFDPFNNSNWQQSNDSYLGMGFRDLDIDMDIGFNMDMGESRAANPTTYTDHRPSLNFDDAFTDDDFSFFDNPPKSGAIAAPMPIPSSATSADFNFNRPPQISIPPSLDEARSIGPGPPSALHAPWTPATHGDVPTPIDAFEHHRVPDLIPSSPIGPSPEFHPSPETPTIQLSFDTSIKQPTPSKVPGTVVFDAIPFSASHKDADSKYSFGKFALPTPSPEPGYEDPPMTPPPNSASSVSWRARYDRKTNPRFGIVKQLIEVKQRSMPSRQIKKPPKDSWADDLIADDDDRDMDVSSDSDSEEDANDIESECESPQRPSTPPPSYLPLGPTLLHCQFEHSHLLPLSTPLRSPGAIALAPGQSSTIPFASVPTPVSPAAALGAASEQSKSLESAAFSVATEFVVNPLWADTWKANNQRAGASPTIWPDDVKGAAEILKQVRGAEGLPDLSTIFGLGDNAKLVPLEPPYISIGKSDAVIQVLPPALRFWDKLGLGPKAGRKDVEIYAFYEDVEDQKRLTVDTWLSTAAAFYKSRQMGQFVRGTTNPANDALLPLRFDSTFRKALVTFVSNIVHTSLPIVILLFIPVTAMTMASPTLRQVFSSSKKALKNFTDGQVIFHLIPDCRLMDVEHSPRGSLLLDELCSSIYNRVCITVERNLFRPSQGSVHIPSQLFQGPTFTLARPLQTKVTYVRSTRAPLDVVDRFTLLHIGYQISPCRKWVFACCVDQRGEEYALDLWLNDAEEEGEGDDAGYSVVARVWRLALDFASKADIEWHMVITKLGFMSPHEIQAWHDQFHMEAASRTTRQPPLHAVLISADNNSPWTFVDPSSTPPSPSRLPRTPSNPKNNNNNAYFNDVSASFYTISPHRRLSASIPPSNTLYAASLVSEPPPPPAGQVLTSSGDVAMSPEPTGTPSYHHHHHFSEDPPEPPLPHPTPFIPLSTSSLIRVPCNPSDASSIAMLHIHVHKYLHQPGYHDSNSDSNNPDAPFPVHSEITNNFYELAVLSAARFRLDHNPVLPFHLAAIDSMRFCLDCDWEHLESPIDP